MKGWNRLLPVVLLLVIALYLAAAQPWLRREPYSSFGANMTELAGWSSMSQAGRLWIHLSMRDAINNPRVVGVSVSEKQCGNITGNLISRGETDIYADCHPGASDELYNGTITMYYEKADRDFRFDYQVVGLFSGLRQ